MTKADKEIYNRGLSPSNNHHHGRSYREQKRLDKKKPKFSTGFATFTETNP